MKGLWRYAGILAIAAVILAGCRDDKEDVAYASPAFTNIVTYEGNNDIGALFTYVEIDDMPPVTLQSSVTLDSARAHAGDRMVIRYLAEGESGASDGATHTITLQGAAVINSSKVVCDTIANYPEWNRDGVYLYSVWRTGRYINLHGLLPYDEAPRQFKVVADYTTIDDAEVHLYLVHQLKEVVNTHLRAYYASFDISDVWDRASCRSVALHIENTNLTDRKLFIFNKYSD